MSKIGSLLLAEAPIFFQVGEQTVNAVYRPGVYTEAYEAKLLQSSKASKSPTGVDDINQLLCDLLVSWDLDDDAGVIPVERAELAARLPLPVGALVSVALMKALRTGEAIRATLK